jgi:hypothetical protein
VCGMVQIEKLQKRGASLKINLRSSVSFFDMHLEYFSNPPETYRCKMARLVFPFIIKVAGPFTCKESQIFLEKINIQARDDSPVIFYESQSLKCFQKELGAKYSNADRVMIRGVLLPLDHSMIRSMFNCVHATGHKFIGQYC